MFILDGEVEMTIEDETQTMRPGRRRRRQPRRCDTRLLLRDGRHVHGGARAVPLDHVPDRELDLVLGPDGGATHVER